MVVITADYGPVLSSPVQSIVQSTVHSRVQSPGFTVTPLFTIHCTLAFQILNEQTHPHCESITSSPLVDSQPSTEPFSTTKVKLFTTGTAQYRAFKITFPTTKVKLFTTVFHTKQRKQLAGKFTATNGSIYSVDWNTGLEYWTGLLD